VSPMFNTTDDLRIAELKPLIPPAILVEELPLDEAGERVITEGRNRINRVLDGNDDRLVVVVGPCSIHDTAAGREYAQRLAELSASLKDDLVIVMRVYFEKPRTTVGWKGLINDPDIDNSFNINRGLRLARGFLLQVTELGLPAAVEFLDAISPQFIADLVSWGAIGARTTESQVHRELASGLSVPVGFKNGTDGNVQIAIDAIRAAQRPHHFLSVTKQGLAAIVATSGNDYGHLILRGGSHGPNYSAQHVAEAVDALEQHELRGNLMIDASHGNSEKDHNRQKVVLADVCKQISGGSHAISGVMIESHLVAGNQKWGPAAVSGQGLSDARIGWAATVERLQDLAAAVRARRG
jgi:3-deoxy-7-phosphoheptulonate synthase